MSETVTQATPAVPTEAPKVEATQATPQVPETKAQDEKISAVIQEKKRIYGIQKAMKQKEQILAQREAELANMQAAFNEARSNPIAALQAAGWSYKDATDFVLNNGQMTPEQQVKMVQDELQSFKEQQVAKERWQAEQQARAAQRQVRETLQEFNHSVHSFIDQNSDKYELTKLNGAQELVIDTVQEFFNRTGKIMPTQEAADLVEKYYEDQVDANVKSKKWQARSQPKQEQVQGREDRPNNEFREQTRTLHNSITTSITPDAAPAKTEQEAFKRALAKLG